jgi:hypothetical protein
VIALAPASLVYTRIHCSLRKPPSMFHYHGKPLFLPKVRGGGPGRGCCCRSTPRRRRMQRRWQRWEEVTGEQHPAACCADTAGAVTGSPAGRQLHGGPALQKQWSCSQQSVVEERSIHKGEMQGAVGALSSGATAARCLPACAAHAGTSSLSLRTMWGGTWGA